MASSTNLPVTGRGVVSSCSKTTAGPAPPPPSSPLVHLSFTRDASCFVAADASTVHWISCDTFNLRGFHQERDPARTVVTAAGDMLHEKASICVIVSRVAGFESESEHVYSVRRWRPSSRKYHKRHNEREGAAVRAGEVRAVRVHGDKTVLVYNEGHVDVHGTADAKHLHRVDTGGSNPLGICAVAQGAGGDAPLVVACPGKAVGEVHVERCVGDESDKPLAIRAHSSSLAFVAMSEDGRLLATASAKGTVLRVFYAAGGALLQELRRGFDRADIHCLAFSPDSKWLAASSDKGTIHVFSINVGLAASSPEEADDHEAPKSTSAAKPNQSWSSYLRGFVPGTGYFQQQYSVARFRLREGVKYMVAFSHEPHDVLIIGMDGSFYRCQFDPVNGGDMEQLEYRNFMKVE